VARAVRGPRRRSRRRSGTRHPLVTACGVALVALLVVGVSLPAASFTHGESPRGSAVDITSDENAALTLHTADAVYINDTSDLVAVTNHLGRDVTVTVTLRSDSTEKGDLVVDNTTVGNETSFTLAAGTQETVRIEIPDDSSLTDETVYFHVSVSESGLTADATDRSTPINA
jgi:Tfp pilus assembly protein PilV